MNVDLTHSQKRVNLALLLAILLVALFLRVYELGNIPAGLHYDETGKQFLVISDATNSVSLVSAAGEVTACMALPGRTQEGITLDDEGHLYIAQDAGGITKLRWLRD